jgi:hypothetical protein
VKRLIERGSYTVHANARLQRMDFDPERRRKANYSIRIF